MLECKWQRTHYQPGLNYGWPSEHAVGEVTENVPEKPRPAIGGSAYLYSIHVKNHGPKVIRSMAWDYVFNDPDSKKELGRRSLNSFEKIGANETRWIDLRPLALGPPKIATVEGLKKDGRSPFDEHIEIKCVLYADGTGWRAPESDPQVCDQLVRLTLNPNQRPR